MIKTGMTVGFAGNKPVKIKVKDSSKQGYHFKIVSEPTIHKGKLGSLDGLVIPVIEQETGRLSHHPLKTLIFSEDEKLCYFPHRLPGKTKIDKKGNPSFIPGKMVDFWGKPQWGGLFLPVILKDKPVAMVSYQNLIFGGK